MGLSPDQLFDALLAQGHSEEEAMEAAGMYAKSKYEPEKTELRPLHDVLSDRTVPFINGDITLRVMNIHDKKRALPILVQAVAELVKQDPGFKSTEEFLSKGHDHAFNYVFDKVMNIVEQYQGDSYPKWIVAVLEEIANLASTQTRPVVAAEIISLPADQLAVLIKTMYEVNKKHFLSLWGQVPLEYRTAIHLRLFTPVLKLISNLKRFLQPTQA